MGTLADRARELGADVCAAIDRLAVPVFVLDADGILVYVNDAFVARLGDQRGKHFTRLFASESVLRAREAFARKMIGVDVATDYEYVVFDRNGAPVRAEVNSVALEAAGHVAGIFGLVEVRDLRRPIVEHRAVRLTPRQAETLRHLAAGCTTDQMAERMGIGVPTVRNHVRDLLRKLDAHSRLEAVARAHELGLIGA
ncbi:MAG TPA: LuxR C-terminal-related transcriptional regulator [Gaiellaceae bacterium]|nr:LuxR C-terminal-related transcriptional regulator [Gaiellaceae bacterium]